MEDVTEDDDWSAFMVASLATLYLASRDFDRTLRYLVRAFDVLRHAHVERDSRLILPRGKRPVELLWTVIVNIETQAHLEAWLAAFGSLDAAQRRTVMRSKDATLGCVVLADRLMFIEMRKPADQRDWSSVLLALQQLRGRADELGWEHLAACALKSDVNVHGECLKNVETCRAKVRAFVDDDARSEQAKSLVSGMFGKMLVGSGEYCDALPWLDRAIHAPPSELAHDQMMTLLAAAKSSAFANREATIGYAEAAAEIARSNPVITDIEATKAFAESAIAVVSRNPTQEGALQAYPAWSEAAQRMLLVAKRDDEWKDIFILFGHVHSYLVQLAVVGKAPEGAWDGGPSAPPYQGMFFTSHPQRIQHYREEHVVGITWFMFQYAWSARDEEAASDWARRAVDAIEGVPQTHVTAAIRLVLTHISWSPVPVPHRGQAGTVSASRARS